LVGLEILGYQLPNRPSRQVNEKDFDKIHKWLGEKRIQPIVFCCKAMLRWAPDDRMTADDALQHPLAHYREKSVTNKRTLE